MKIFDKFMNRAPGVWYFVPDDEHAYESGKPCYGFGAIKYDEGSEYVGNIYFDGAKYHKQGLGMQDLTYSYIGNAPEGIDYKKGFFIGNFDYKTTGWVYGNGVLYFVDKETSEPRFWVKGFYNRLIKIGNWQGDFNYDSLASGFTPDMEQEDLPDMKEPVFAAEMQNLAKVDGEYTVFIGDSYFEFWQYETYAGERTFYEVFPNAHNLNLGLGGTRFVDWKKYVRKMSDMPCPKNIVINLGFNDIHSEKTAEQVYDDYLAVIGDLKSLFPTAKIYLLNVVAAPGFPAYFDEEVRFNTMTAKTAEEMGVQIIDARSAIAAQKANMFYIDNDHLNADGYKIVTALLKGVL